MHTRAAIMTAFTGFALAAACGGSTSNSSGTDGGGGSSGGSSSSGSSSGTTTSSSSGATSDDGGGVACGLMGMTCSTSQMCCITQTGATCADSCADGSIAYGCGSATACGSGSVCCFDLRGGSSCETSCDTEAGTLQLCTMDSDCPTGQSCVGGGLGKVCYTVPDGGFQRPDGSFTFDGGGTDGASSEGSAVTEGGGPADGASE